MTPLLTLLVRSWYVRITIVHSCFNLRFLFRKPNPAVMAKHDEVALDVAVIAVDAAAASALSEEKGVEGVGTEDLENEEEGAGIEEDQGPVANATLTENQETTERESAYFIISFLFLTGDYSRTGGCVFNDEPQIGTNETNDLRQSELSL